MTTDPELWRRGITLILLGTLVCLILGMIIMSLVY